MNLSVKTRSASTAPRATLRPYQSQAKNDIYAAWDAGAVNVLAVLPTGAGKTVTFSDILNDHRGVSCAIAHRQELVSQISLALAYDRVPHQIIGPKSVVKLCVNTHMAEVGVSYYSPSALCAVAGVDTLIRRGDELASWLQSVTLWVQDEAHHVLATNKWGSAANMFPNAKGLGVTATPLRADGRGLGRHADGLFDVMVEGPGMRDLVNAGYLTDYRIFAPSSDIDISAVNVSQVTGDFNPKKLKVVVRKSQVIGDVVTHYLKIAPGKLAVTFTTDVETATDIAVQFNLAGVPAKVISAKTPDAERIDILRRFKRRELLQLINVDLFGEGFDLPAIEVVIMARPTQSYGLYVQQFGRALRLMLDEALRPYWDEFSNEERRTHIANSLKPHAIIIDHVGNVERHGLPDARRNWSLDRRERRSSPPSLGSIPVKTCLNTECLAVYERIYSACPFCGHITPPTARSAAQFVDGDLYELDPGVLAQMRGEVERVNMDKELYREELVAKHTPRIAQLALVKLHVEHQEAQETLRRSIAWWAGHQRAANRNDSESYRRFYFTFGVDVMAAQTLNTKEAIDLTGRINENLERLSDSAER